MSHPMARRDDLGDRTRTATEEEQAAAPRTQPVLIVIGAARKLGASRRVLPIPGALEIGRQPDAKGDGGWAVDDDRVSRRHALVQADGRRGSAQLTDLGSRNGTIVDGQAVSGGPVPLLNGSLIFLGTHAAVFRFVSDADLAAISQDLADPFTPVATTNPDLARRFQMLRHLAKGNEDLLIVGETGVGKEQIARAVHRASQRWGKFVAINCPALPGTLIESELFGYVKGAHSQASKDKLGLIDEAEHGTLFLDEFAEIPQEVQAKLLRFLEDRDLQALGSTKQRRIDVRVLAATNRALSALRKDVAARLGPEPIRLLPLRKHPEDIAALASHFLSDRAGMGLEVTAFHALCLHDWPDNIRGLRKVLRRAADLAAAEGLSQISLAHLPEGIGAHPRRAEPANDVPEAEPAAVRRSPRAAPTKAELEALLERHGWVVAQAAREIDRDHAVVWRWIKRYGLGADRARN
jgi:sigma-54 dependent transcriptional regulator, acetoin dehydrogenase operon transcriptional activator AcoR